MLSMWPDLKSPRLNTADQIAVFHTVMQPVEKCVYFVSKTVEEKVISLFLNFGCVSVCWVAKGQSLRMSNVMVNVSGVATKMAV